jgi:hypothetical protein
MDNGKRKKQSSDLTGSKDQYFSQSKEDYIYIIDANQVFQ